MAVLGIFTPPHPPPFTPDTNSTIPPTVPPTADSDDHITTTSGTIAIFGDSSCFDDANERTTCHWLLGHILQVTNFDSDPLSEFPLDSIAYQADPFQDPAWNMLPPARPEDVPFAKHSRVVGRNKPLVCPAQLTQSHVFEWKDERNLTKVEWVEREIVPRRSSPKVSSLNDNMNQSYGYLPMYLLDQFFVLIYNYFYSMFRN